MDQRLQYVVLRIGWNRRAAELAESVRPWSAGTVAHAWRQEQPEERLLIRQRLDLVLVLCCKARWTSR